MAVFVPMAFFPGSVGIIYRQFSVTMVAAIGFSAFLALSLTPALCATLLKPVAAGHGHAKKGVFGWFNRMLEGGKEGYSPHRRLLAEAHRPLDAGLCRAAGRPVLGFRQLARRLPAGRRPGLRHHRRADAVGFVLRPHRGRDREGREISGAAPGRRQRHLPHRLQLLRPGHEHRAGLHHAEGLVGARAEGFRGGDCRRHQPRSVVVDPRRQDLRAAAAADRQSRQLLGLLVPPAGPRPEGLSGPDARAPTS